MGIQYGLTKIENVKKYADHYKLQLLTGHSELTVFEIVSSWSGHGISPNKTLISIDNDEFEAVKNFLLTLRS